MARPRKLEIIRPPHETSPGVKEIGAYSLVHKTSGKVYHGSTDNLHRRITEHEGDLRNNTHRNANLQSIVNADPSLEMKFYPTKTIDEARQLEQKLIDDEVPEQRLNTALDTSNIMQGLWQNPDMSERFRQSRLGNQNAVGSRHTEEWKQRASERMAGNQNLRGHKHSDETRAKMSVSHQNRPSQSEDAIRRSAEGRTKRRVVIDGVEYPNAAAAAAVVGITRDGVVKRCRSANFPSYQEVEK